jgi:hypothetical protein
MCTVLIILGQQGSDCCLLYIGFLLDLLFNLEDGDVPPDYMALYSRRQNSLVIFIIIIERTLNLTYKMLPAYLL